MNGRKGVRADADALRATQQLVRKFSHERNNLWALIIEQEHRREHMDLRIYVNAWVQHDDALRKAVWLRDFLALRVKLVEVQSGEETT